MRLSVIVPVLNDAVFLEQRIGQLVSMQQQGVEIIVVDGGSADDSAAVAQVAGLKVMRSARGRARQMNVGATAANGSVLLFLHADTVLPDNAMEKVEHALMDARCVWGRFDLRIRGKSAWLPVVATMINLRSRVSGIATGDQAMFIRRDVFHHLGGFPDQPLMEDIELSKRLLAWSRPACIAAKVETSGRRWDSKGVWKTIWLMWQLRFRYWRGDSPDLLADRYR